MDDNNVISPSSGVSARKVVVVVFLVGLAGVLIAGGVGVGFYFGKSSMGSTVASCPDPGTLPVPTPVVKVDETAGWETYKVNPDQLKGQVSYLLKLPVGWKQMEHSSNFNDTETFQGNLQTDNFKLVVHQEKNINFQTGEPYGSLGQVAGVAYEVPALSVGGQRAIQVLPRAGSETDYKVLFFSKNGEMVISIELNSIGGDSGVGQAEKLFKQILSTFEFEEAEWSLYTNQKYSFSFNYPGGWLLGDTKVFGSRTVTEFQNESLPVLDVTVIANYNQETGKPYLKLDEFVGVRQKLSKKIDIAGQSGVKISDQGDPGHVVPYEEAVLFSRDKKFLISLYYKGGNGELDEILSSFHFVN